MNPHAATHPTLAIDATATDPDDCPLCRAQTLEEVAAALQSLGATELDAGRFVGSVRAASWPPIPVRAAPRPGRNDPCPCGSGKKYKRCHLGEDERRG